MLNTSPYLGMPETSGGVVLCNGAAGKSACPRASSEEANCSALAVGNGRPGLFTGMQLLSPPDVTFGMWRRLSNASVVASKLKRVASYSDLAKHSGSLIYTEGDSARDKAQRPSVQGPESSAGGNRRKRPPPSYASLFQERTTFHGIRDFHRTKVPWARAIWAAILAIALSASIHGCYNVVKEYITRPVVVSYVIQEATKLPLPDVVVCPFNRFNRSYLFDTLNISSDLAQHLELSFPSPVHHPFQRRRYGKALKRLDEAEAELDELLERIGNMSFNQLIEELTIGCEAFFEDLQLCKNIRTPMTSAGKCFRIPGPDQEGDGFGFGHRLIIKLPVHLYHPGVNQMLNEGVAIMLVERGMGIGHDLAFIPSGVHAIVPLSATRYEFMNDPPRIMCEKEVDASFSRVWCFDNCRMEKAETRCNCSLAPSRHLRAPNICTAKQFFRCFAPEFFSGNRSEVIERCKSKCRSPCNYWYYDKTISYAHFPSEGAKFFVRDDVEWAAMQHTIILEVFFTNLDYKLIRHVQSMSMSGFVAQIGGQISLWIGGSIISLIQLFVYLFTSICVYLQSTTKERRRNSSMRKKSPGDSAQSANSAERARTRSEESGDVDSRYTIRLERSHSCDSIKV